MDDLDDREKSSFENKDEASQYLDCIRLVEGGHLRRFESVAAKFDIVAFENSDGENQPTKPLIFYAIDHNDETFLRVLLEMEIPLDKKYSVMVPLTSTPNSELVRKTLNAAEYAREFRREPLAKLIEQRSKLSPYIERFHRVLQKNETRRCEQFLRRLHNDEREKNVAIRGFFFGAQLGSIRLLDYFLSRWKVDINTIDEENSFPTTALLTAITNGQNEAAKFLLFRHADPSIKGEYDNALVTALEHNSSNDLLRLLLDKNVDLTARHPHYPKLTLRQFCVLTNRVQAKKELDGYIVRLIIKGDYSRLKWLVDRGYKHINVRITSQRNARQLADERYFEKIVQLIDHVEHSEMKARIKMNY